MSQPQKSGCAGLLASFFGLKAKSDNQPIASPEPENLPYQLTQAFLTPAEISFYHVLQQALDEHMTICPKVSLGDLFYPQTSDRTANQTWRNKIDRKHVDFLLCDSNSMRPLMGIELDDASHQQATRQERDHFVEEVFVAAGLPLFRQPARHTYQVQELSAALRRQLGMELLEETKGNNAHVAGKATPAQLRSTQAEPAANLSDGVPSCPNCRQLMVLRTIKKAGPNYGQQFWGCQDYPRCRGMRPYQIV
jgi:hypothetical protein